MKYIAIGYDRSQNNRLRNLKKRKRKKAWW